MKFEPLRALFGLIIATVSVICIFLYIIIQKIIISDRGLMKYSTYKIVVCYGFIDIAQLLVYICNGIFAIMGTTVHQWVEKLSFCWYNIGSLTVLLAINRLTLLYYGVRAEYFFNATRTWVILFFAIAVPSICSLIWLTPYATYGFDAELLMWEYDSPDFMPSYDRLTTLTTSVLATICYLLVLILVLKKSWSTSSKVNDSSRRRDTLLTLQVMINGGYTVCVSTYFMFLRPYYVPYTVIFNAVDVILCLLWNGKSPIMHLIFNGHIRTKFLENIRDQKVVSLIQDVTSCSQHKTPKSSSAVVIRTPVNELSPKRGLPTNASFPCTGSRNAPQLKQTFLITPKSFISVHH